jgi:hypothetical protein
MKTHLHALALLAAAVTGCGFTYGASAVEHSVEAQADAAGVDLLRVVAAVRDDVVVCGGAAELRARLSALDWVRPGEDSGGPTIALGFVRAGDAAELRLSGGTEATTLAALEVRAPAEVATALQVTRGGLTVCDFTAPVTAAAGRVTVRDVSGPADIRADVVTLDSAPPVDLVASGSVTGRVAGGGQILAGGSVTLTATSADFRFLDVESTGPSGSSVSLTLPASHGFTIGIRAGTGTARVLVGDIDYHSTEEGAPSPSEGLVFEVRGGGPLVAITAEAASILVRESPTP